MTLPHSLAQGSLILTILFNEPKETWPRVSMGVGATNGASSSGV